jgi:hypothetical protein
VNKFNLTTTPAMTQRQAIKHAVASTPISSSLVFLLTVAVAAFGQATDGALHLAITDAGGRGVRAPVSIVSLGNQYSKTMTTGSDGSLEVTRLPFGAYRIEIRQPGFAAASRTINIRSSVPTRCAIQLELASVNESVTVRPEETLLGGDQAGSVNRVGSDQIRDRLGSIPGRSIQDLVNSQPGWIFEGNAVLHPRGSENDTQFVIDGIPLTDNRSPGFGPEIEADEIHSLNIYTSGIPAEYGRKMGGVVEVDTLEDSQPGIHGETVLSGGSFATAGGYAQAQYSCGKYTVGASASGSTTERYLNPVIPQNYSNTGSLGDVSIHYQRNQSAKDKLALIVRHEFSGYDIPKEMLQQAAGQKQTAGNAETMAIGWYQRTFSDRALIGLRAMVRDNSNHFDSNADSTPIQVFQRNRFREGYFKFSATFDHGAHEFKAGLESDNTLLHEDLSYLITDSSQFDDGTPLTFNFMGSRPSLEQSAFLEDLIRLHNLTIAAGIRWDHYQLLMNRHAVQPRLALSYSVPPANLVLHFSYDRVFQTPSFENILLSSSDAVQSFDPQNFKRLPVRPSTGDYYEAGLSKVFFKQTRIDANYFKRVVNDFADDDQINNTSISFPIAFRSAIIYGIEAKLSLPEWRGTNGFASYSYSVGNARFPVTGGLFLGDNATAATTQLSGHFPVSQDQRNTVHGRLRFQLAPRVWIAGGVQFDSGLPFEFDGDPDQVLAQYGQPVLDRLNFNRGRILPAFQVNASAGFTLHHSDRQSTTIQIDDQNLNNVLDVLDFGGVFSGTAIGPPRSISLRLATTF